MNYQIFDHKTQSWVFGKTQKEISEATDISYSSIRALFGGALKSVVGRYSLNPETKPRKSRNRRSVKLLDTQTGEIIASDNLVAMGEKVGCTYQSFRPLMLGKQEMLRGRYKIAE